MTELLKAMSKLSSACSDRSRGVAGGRDDVRVPALAGLEVDERDLDVVAAGPSTLLPELVGAADVDDAQRPRQARRRSARTGGSAARAAGG